MCHLSHCRLSREEEATYLNQARCETQNVGLRKKSVFLYLYLEELRLFAKGFFHGEEPEEICP